MNHSWQATFYVTARGLTTSPIPYDDFIFSFDFDFLSHELIFLSSTGARETLRLEDRTVADFYAEFRALLEDHGIHAKFVGHPNELSDATPFSEDRTHRVYQRDAAERFFQALIQADRVLKIFRSRFIGKCSPIHFFWGSFDLAVTRFSGRRAPTHPGGVPSLPDRITREAYSHEVCSCGFWPGNETYPKPAFYSYAYPAPAGFENYPVSPAPARYDSSLREFVLPYDEVRKAKNPDEFVLEFLESTYEAAAFLGHWHRETVEESPFLHVLQSEQKRKTPRPEDVTASI